MSFDTVGVVDLSDDAYAFEMNRSLFAGEFQERRTIDQVYSHESCYNPWDSTGFLQVSKLVLLKRREDL